MTFLSRNSLILPAVVALGVTWAVQPGVAQEVGARRGGTAISSPEVASDRRVTFRLRGAGGEGSDCRRRFRSRRRDAQR